MMNVSENFPGGKAIKAVDEYIKGLDSVEVCHLQVCLFSLAIFIGTLFGNESKKIIRALSFVAFIGSFAVCAVKFGNFIKQFLPKSCCGGDICSETCCADNEDECECGECSATDEDACEICE